MKIISAKQSRALDLVTMQNEPIASIDLMERTAQLIYNQIFLRYGKDYKYIILCGNGNNGGDGLVIARLLSEQGCKTSVYIDLHNQNRSEENSINLARLKNTKVKIYDFDALQQLSEPQPMVWVDAIFGVGLSRPLDGKWKKLIQYINSKEGHKLAIDIPSGLFADEIINQNDVAFKADYTYTIGQPKLTFMLPETAMFVGEFDCIDIQLDVAYLHQLESSYYYAQPQDMSSMYKPREKFSHKGTYGHALLVAGSYGKMGAAVLATKGALKAGAGLVTSYVPHCGYHIMQVSNPEAMCITNDEENIIDKYPNTKNYKSIGVGPGLGTHTSTKDSFLAWLKSENFKNKGLVLDADALNLLSTEKEALRHLPSQSILTPHPKEFERLTHKTSNSLERLKLAQSFTQEYNVILVLKDAITSVISSDGLVYFNATGNAALASGGSGDTLTGVITGLLAQSYSPFNAARLGVWLHGKAADIGLQNESMESFSASDITRYLGKAFKTLG